VAGCTALLACMVASPVNGEEESSVLFLCFGCHYQCNQLTGKTRSQNDLLRLDLAYMSNAKLNAIGLLNNSHL